MGCRQPDFARLRRASSRQASLVWRSIAPKLAEASESGPPLTLSRSINRKYGANPGRLAAADKTRPRGGNKACDRPTMGLAVAANEHGGPRGRRFRRRHCTDSGVGMMTGGGHYDKADHCKLM